MIVRTREQNRGASVARLLTKLLEDPNKKVHEAYGARARAFGVMVRTNGLARTVSYFLAKGGQPDEAQEPAGGRPQQRAYREFAQHLTVALNEMVAWKPSGTQPRPKELLAYLLSNETGLADYMALTRESLALAEWFQRLSVSVLDVKPGTGYEEG